MTIMAGAGWLTISPPDGSAARATMNLQTIVAVFAGAMVATIVSFWLHARLAGTGERVGPVSMAAFVLGWLCVITAVVTGMFLLMVAVTR
jgi:hypothetical protein